MSVDKPEDIDIIKHIGKAFKVKDDKGNDKVVVAERIVGSMVHPTDFEIHANGEAYLICALDLFAQVNGEKVSDVEIALFRETQFHVKRTGATPSLWQRKKITLN